MSLPIVVDAPDNYEDPLDLMDEIDQLKKEKDAAILAHFYVDGEIQDIADFTGDSLKLARDATRTESSQPGKSRQTPSCRSSLTAW